MSVMQLVKYHLRRPLHTEEVIYLGESISLHHVKINCIIASNEIKIKNTLKQTVTIKMAFWFKQCFFDPL